MLPVGTLGFKGSYCQGGTQRERRITVLLCTNMDGSDIQLLLVIRMRAKPRCFRGNRSVPVKYVASGRTWMTWAIFGEWLETFDRDVGRQGRKVCLLLDNSSAHNVEDTDLKKVPSKFFFSSKLHLSPPTPSTKGSLKV